MRDTGRAVLRACMASVRPWHCLMNICPLLARTEMCTVSRMLLCSSVELTVYPCLPAVSSAWRVGLANILLHAKNNESCAVLAKAGYHNVSAGCVVACRRSHSRRRLTSCVLVPGSLACCEPRCPSCLGAGDMCLD